MVKYLGDIDWTKVALRKESVDRNIPISGVTGYARVALRKESVDRNMLMRRTQTAINVALRKESVDRNHDDYLKLAKFEGRSPQGERG